MLSVLNLIYYWEDKLLSNIKDINFCYSTETLIKYWKNYFYVTHAKEIITNCIVICIALLMHFFSEYTVLAELIILFCILYIALIYYFYCYVALSKFKKYKKYYDEMVIVISEDNIQVNGELNESKTKWEAFTRLFEGKDYYLIYTNFRSSILIPKAVFVTGEDKQWFENKLIKLALMESK